MTLPARNLLAEEASPYLQQHSDNPVHWRAWSPDALAEAREHGRPILLSIGYAACHWCHVMAHESFENDAVAAVMNRLFVNIKVDREERPDIDQIYMAALHAMGEQGGWPLTMFLTPDGKPFWGGTYFPREARYGRPGFVQVLEAVDKAWREKQQSLAESADGLTVHVEQRLAGAKGKAVLDRDTLADLAARLDGMIDRDLGGLRGAPKFPNAPFMQTLWLSWLRDGRTTHRDAVLTSLEKMLAGGIYDHVGGGLSRYSTDAEWLVPHFEKMLYDNAQLVRMCNWAYA
ncbi:MAG: thioredoxin domain-containing protein, partial [Mesorhizobium sp.]